MTDEERRELAELFREDDRLRAEREAREQGSAYMRRDGGAGGLVRRTQENASASAAEAEPVPFNGDGDDSNLDDYSKAIVKFTVMYVQEKLDKLGREQRNEVGRLKKQLNTVSEEIEADRANGIEVYCNSLERRFTALAAENIEIKGLLGDALAKLDDARKRLAAEKNLTSEIRQLKALFDGRFEQMTKAIANIEARAAAEHDRISELRQDIKSDTEILRHEQEEITRRYVALAQHL